MEEPSVWSERDVSIEGRGSKKEEIRTSDDERVLESGHNSLPRERLSVTGVAVKLETSVHDRPFTLVEELLECEGQSV